MRLNKIEKIIVVVLLVGLIIGIGIFMFVVPAYEQVGKSQKKLDNLRTEQSELNAKLARLETIDADIDSAREEVLDLEKKFYPELTTYEASEIAMGYVEDCGLDTHSISISSITTENLQLEQLDLSEVVYSLKTYSQTAGGHAGEVEEGKFTDNGKEYLIQISDINDAMIIETAGGTEIKKSDYTDKMKKIYQNTVCRYAQRTNAGQNVAVVVATFNVDGTYRQYLDFLDYINNLDRASAVVGIEIPMTYTEIEISDEGALGQRAGTSELVVCSDETKLEGMAVTLKLYCVEPMNKVESLTIGSGDTQKTIDLKKID